MTQPDLPGCEGIGILCNHLKAAQNLISPMVMSQGEVESVGYYKVDSEGIHKWLIHIEAIVGVIDLTAEVRPKVSPRSAFHRLNMPLIAVT